MKLILVLLVSFQAGILVGQEDTTMPAARARGHFIYHPSSKGMLLVDGYINHTDSTDNNVWKWDGKHWVKIVAYGPGSRMLNAAALNNRTGNIEVFGGWGKKTIEDKKNDLWSFNGDRWNKLNADMIGTRDHHKMVYADHLDAFVVYGGFDFNFKNDTVTWLLRDGHFTAVPCNSPGARGNFGMTYDPGRKKVVLFGGNFAEPDKPADLWEFDGNKWEEIKVKDIGITSTYMMTYARNLEMSIVQNSKGETWGWDGKNMKRIAVNGPAEFGVALGYDPERKVVAAFGGYGPQRTASSALWELSNGEWKKIGDNGRWKQVSRDKYEILDPSVDITIPEKRWAHHLTYDEANHRILLFGGGGRDRVLGDMWGWNGESWNEMTLGGPPARNKAAFVFDPRRKKAILFGGVSAEDKNMDDTWEWDGRDWTELKIKSPVARAHVLGAYDKKNGVVLIFGGFGPTGVLNDTWTFDGTTWKLVNKDGPANCLPHGIVYDEKSNSVLMITVTLNDGSSAAKPKNEMWQWVDTAWQKLNVNVPSIVGLQAFVSTGNGEIILYDGHDEPGSKGTTWKYSIGKWKASSHYGPGIRMGHVMAYDKKRKKVILFGGGKANSAERYNDTWEWNEAGWKRVK